MVSDSRPLVLITQRFDHSVLLRAARSTEVHFQYEKNLFSRLDLLEKAQGIILRSSQAVDKDFLNKCPQLKVLITATSGFDHLDLKELQARSVTCYHVPEAQMEAASELTLLHILTSQRRFSLAQKQLQSGQWERSLLVGRELSGQRLGLIGLGRVGMRVAEKALALGLVVSAYDPFLPEHDSRIEMLGFEELMRSSDIVSLHVPLTTKTRHMIQAGTLKWMSSDATLINMSRGEVVNEAELIEHLFKNPQFQAGLDVFNREPLSTESPLLSLKNVNLTPHIGASTEQALKKASEAAVERTLSFFAGNPSTEGLLPPQAPWFEG